MVTNVRVGLISVSNEQLLTLYSVGLNITVLNKFAKIDATHKYSNTSQTSEDTKLQ